MLGNSSGIPYKPQRAGTDSRGMCYTVILCPFFEVIVWALLNSPGRPALSQESNVSSAETCGCRFCCIRQGSPAEREYQVLGLPPGSHRIHGKGRSLSWWPRCPRTELDGGEIQLSMWERSSQGNQLMFRSALEAQSLSVGMDLWVSTTSPQCQQVPWRWEMYSYGNWKCKEGSVLLCAKWCFPDLPFLAAATK